MNPKPRFAPSLLRGLLAAGILASGASAALRRPLFKHSASAAGVDTLEVFALYVQFADETDVNNEGATTGRGHFGTDKDTSYALDPNSVAIRSHRFYLEKHFQFARNYFDKVSDGRVVILPRIFPLPDGEGRITPVELSRRMKAYNPAVQDKDPKQKTRDFESQRAQALMTFVSESAHGFDINDSVNNPFRVAKAEAQQDASPFRHRVFLIFHAGHSRLIDGGTLGPLGANTPNDFTDFFVTKDDFKFLDSATDNFLPTGKPAPQQRKDSLGVALSTGDTITEFMMLSEAASQDKTNWGINGILVNQLARQMGMPDLFDVVRGISQVGFFDVMDFAGYNTLDGFLPVFPSAWTRAFMGWDDPVVARRDAAFADFPIQAADRPGPGRVRSVKVPINEREYLLVENRQRAGADSTVTIFYSKLSGATDFKFGVDTSVTVPVGFIDSLFLDSTCATWKGAACGKKQLNTLKPRGVITGASHYDLGLPGSGLLVWHVNEWFLDAFLRADAVNAYLGDTLRSQYKGLELVEADGIPSIGKEFKDPLGQAAFDYGTAQDMLPHLFRKRKDPPRDTNWAAPETLSVIGSYGFANTNAWNDGRTHIVLKAQLPAAARLAPGVGGFTGDSVFGFRDTALTLRVAWPNDSSVAQPPGSAWPVRLAPAGNPEAVNILRDGGRGGPYVVAIGDSGALQTYTAAGLPALSARDTARDSAHYAGVKSALASGNTRSDNAAPVNSLADPDGAPLGACVAQDSVFAVLTAKSLRLIRPVADSLQGASRSGGTVRDIPLAGAAGPMAWNNKIFAVDAQAVLRSFALDGSLTDSVALPARAYHALAGMLAGGGVAQVIAAGAGGAAVRVNPATLQTVDMRPAWGSVQPATDEFFSLAVSDFNRDDSDDVFLLGSKGSAILFHTRSDSLGRAFAGYPQRFTRSVNLIDTAQKIYPTEDRSSAALADLDRDGHPDILFSGSNAVFAVNWRGAPLPGWPFLPQPRQDVGFAYGNRLAPPTVIGSTPLTLTLRGKPAVLLGSPDGLVYAVDSLGKPVSYSSFSGGQNTGALMTNRSDWPLTAGGLSLDTSRTPYVHLTLAQLDSGDMELLAQSATGSLSVWSLRNSNANAPGLGWLMPGGDARRSFRLDAGSLGAPKSPADQQAIQEFHLFPSPVRNGVATVHLKIGAAANKARIRVFDLAGNPVAEANFTGLTPGLQPLTHLVNLRRLSPDVYAVLCEVWFAGGKKSTWQRIGVVK